MATTTNVQGGRWLAIAGHAAILVALLATSAAAIVAMGIDPSRCKHVWARTNPNDPTLPLGGLFECTGDCGLPDRRACAQHLIVFRRPGQPNGLPSASSVVRFCGCTRQHPGFGALCIMLSVEVERGDAQFLCFPNGCPEPSFCPNQPTPFPDPNTGDSLWDCGCAEDV